MKTTISVYDFRDAFQRMGRTNFSYEGLGVLFDYFEQYEESAGEEIELDPVAICCDFAEDDPETIAEQYGVAIMGCYSDDPEGVAQAVREHLEMNGAYIGETSTGDIVYQQF